MEKYIFIFIVMAFARFVIPAQNTTYTMDTKFVISANGKEMTATFADNSSAEAFRNLIADAPLTVEMNDYGGFEKVGSLGHNLQTNDTRITTQPGDVILYLGNNITIYYDVNTWSFTRLGKIDGSPTRDAILAVLGEGSTNVTFSLKNASTDDISEIEADSPALNVHVSGRSVTVDGTRDDSPLSVYNIDGQLVYQGFSRKIALPASGTYVIMCGNAKAKIMIK